MATMLSLRKDNGRLKEKLLHRKQQHEEVHLKQAEKNSSHVSTADVLFLHDSLGMGINKTLLSREKVIVEKKLSYTRKDALASLTNSPSLPRVVAVHIGRNDLTNMSTHEICCHMDKLVAHVKEKSQRTKVVISNIVYRNDALNSKADLVNATMNHNYLGDSSICVSSNRNIGATHIATDGTQLKKQGTSLLAGNLKISMVKALGVKVQPPRRSAGRSVCGLFPFFLLFT